jgi:hypothetical protein
MNFDSNKAIAVSNIAQGVNDFSPKGSIDLPVGI